MKKEKKCRICGHGEFSHTREQGCTHAVCRGVLKGGSQWVQFCMCTAGRRNVKGKE